MLWIKNLSIFAIPAIILLLYDHVIIVAIQFFLNEYILYWFIVISLTRSYPENICLIIIIPFFNLNNLLFYFCHPMVQQCLRTHCYSNFSYIRFLSYSILNSEILFSDLKPTSFDHNHLYFSLSSHSVSTNMSLNGPLSCTAMELFLYWEVFS